MIPSKIHAKNVTIVRSLVLQKIKVERFVLFPIVYNFFQKAQAIMTVLLYNSAYNTKYMWKYKFKNLLKFNFLSSQIAVTSMRKNPYYSIYYNSWARLLVLGIAPAAMLIYLNYKVNFTKQLLSDILSYTHTGHFLKIFSPKSILLKRKGKCWIYLSIRLN